MEAGSGLNVRDAHSGRDLLPGPLQKTKGKEPAHFRRRGFGQLLQKDSRLHLKRPIRVFSRQEVLLEVLAQTAVENAPVSKCLLAYPPNKRGAEVPE